MKIASVKGFHDILPGQSALWSWIEATARESFARYGYSEIRLPILERTELFRRSIGEATDIVEKEMYTFADRDDASLTLRPEGTASVVRAYVEHALHQQEPFSKLYYIGPMFRRERPQKGRLRQFWQIGVEAIGRDDAAIDAEVVLLMHDLLHALGVRGVQLDLNSLGCSVCRPRYAAALLEFARHHAAALCDNCRNRVERNPLRLLDCKNPSCREITAEAPLISEHLCEECRDHFGTVEALLGREEVPFRVNPRLVRGLDYYCRTAFEATAEGLGSQNAVGGGGRYDGLVKTFGGPQAPGIGFALGFERLILSMGDEHRDRRDGAEVYIAPIGVSAEAEAAHWAHLLRKDGLRVETSSGRKSLKSQMRLADKLGVSHVLILGDNEIAAGAATVRDMAAKRDFAQALPFPGNADALRQALSQLKATEHQISDRKDERDS